MIPQSKIPEPSNAEIEAAKQKRQEAYDKENWSSSEDETESKSEESSEKNTRNEEVEVKNDELNKDGEENEPIQIEVEPHGQEGFNAEVTAAIIQPSSQSLPGPLTSQEIEALIDEDPLAAINSLIGKALSKSSAKTRQSFVQEVTQPKDQVTQKLDSLRSIIFRKGLLKNLPKDPTLRD